MRSASGCARAPSGPSDTREHHVAADVLVGRGHAALAGGLEAGGEELGRELRRVQPRELDAVAFPCNRRARARYAPLALDDDRARVDGDARRRADVTERADAHGLGDGAGRAIAAVERIGVGEDRACEPRARPQVFAHAAQEACSLLAPAEEL